LAVSLPVLFIEREPLMIKAGSRRLVFAAVFVVSNAWWIINLARRIVKLNESKAFYIGGHDGFLSDTVGSLIDTWFYTQSYPGFIRTAILFLSVAAPVIAAVWWIRRWTDISFSEILLVALAVAVAAPIVEHFMFGSLYPTDRAALYYVPLAGAWLILALDGRIPHSWSPVFSSVLIAALAVHFSRTANFTHTLMWQYDANTKTAVVDIGKRFGGASRPINIGNNWLFEPTINYYRATLRYDWLNPASRDRLRSEDNDVLYCYSGDVQNNQSKYTVLAEYKDTGTLLLQVVR
jgi:hypothetical protein